MGVRFQCPNGHKLHVKTELAGRRGICPECGARFVVPSFSGGRVPEDTGAATPPPSAAASSPAPAAASSATSQASPAAAAKKSDGPASSVAIKAQTPPPADQPLAQGTEQPIAQPTAQPVGQPVAQPMATPPPVAQAMPAGSAATATEPVAWYVRPAAGGQFGPATTEVFHEWIADGRVSADSWVWRTGWADWKAGSEALALVADRPPLDPAAAMAAALEDRVGAMPAVSTAPGATASAVEANTAEQRRLAIKRRKQRMRMVSGLLALVALAMLMALVFVLVR